MQKQQTLAHTALDRHSLGGNTRHYFATFKKINSQTAELLPIYWESLQLFTYNLANIQTKNKHMHQKQYLTVSDVVVIVISGMQL